jgi:sugar lactone lactonase YvrE
MSQIFWISDGTNRVLRKIDASGVIDTPILTSSDPIYLADGFDNPWGACTDSNGNIFLVDEANKIVYGIDTQTLVVTRIAGGGGSTGALNYTFDDPYYVISDTAGNLYVSDSGFSFGEVVLAINMQSTTQTLFGVSIAPGDIAVIAGIIGSGGYSGDGGPATSAELSSPFGLAIDSSGRLYIVDQFSNNIVRRVTPDGTISTFAGTPLTQGFSGDGSSPSAAELARPLGVQLDASGNVYITDSFNECIRAVNMQGTTQTICSVSITAGDIQTIAGTPGVVGYGGDGGPALSALFGNVVSGGIRPWFSGLAPNGDLYVCDTGNFRVRKIDASTGVITTVAGVGTQGYTGDGAAAISAEVGQVFAVLFPQIPTPPPPSSPSTSSEGPCQGRVGIFTYVGDPPALNEGFLLSGFTGLLSFLNGQMVFVLSVDPSAHTFVAEVANGFNIS